MNFTKCSHNLHFFSVLIYKCPLSFDEFLDYLQFFFLSTVCAIRRAQLTTRPKCCQNYCFFFLSSLFSLNRLFVVSFRWVALCSSTSIAWLYPFSSIRKSQLKSKRMWECEYFVCYHCEWVPYNIHRDLGFWSPFQNEFMANFMAMS